MTFVSEKRMSSLQTQWISKANSQQRKGRAGRIKQGVYFCLISKDTYNRWIPEFQVIWINYESSINKFY